MQNCDSGSKSLSINESSSVSTYAAYEMISERRQHIIGSITSVYMYVTHSRSQCSPVRCLVLNRMWNGSGVLSVRKANGPILSFSCS